MIVHDSLTQVERVRALLPALSQIAPSGRTPVFFDAPGGAQVTQRRQRNHFGQQHGASDSSRTAESFIWRTR